MNVLLFSPHLDDVAYSLSGRLLSGRETVQETLLINVFTISDFAPYASEQLQSTEAVSALRLSEDESFRSLLGLRSIELEFPEARLRGTYEDIESLFVSREQAGKDEVMNRLCGAFLNIRSRFTPKRIYVPAAIGGHVDHWVVQISATAVFEGRSEIWFYEDLPYAGELADQEYEAEIREYSRTHCADVVNGPWLERKLKLLRCYSSQVASKDLQSVRSHTQRIHGECSWRPLHDLASHGMEHHS